MSYLHQHKFWHNFRHTDNQICSCGDDVETTTHYLLHFLNYLDERRTLSDNLQSIGENIQDKNDSQIAELLLSGVSSNIKILPSNKYWLLKDLTSILSNLEALIHIFQYTFFNTHYQKYLMTIGCLYFFIIFIFILVQSFFTQFCSSSSDCIMTF